jgi:hypothetical protein
VGAVRSARPDARDSAAFAALLAVMLVTRLPMSAGFLHFQDLSWAVFFLAGFYLRERWRWAFPVLIGTAVAIDLVAIRWMGVDNYCLTAAYWFVVPGYGSLWIGGAWLRRHESTDLRGIAVGAVVLIAAASLCFLITNASFYWIGERVTGPTWAGWVENFTRWYWPFVRVPLVFAGSVLLLRLLMRRAGSGKSFRRA